MDKRTATPENLGPDIDLNLLTEDPFVDDPYPYGNPDPAKAPKKVDNPKPEEGPNWESDENPYKKRFSDSTREFQRLNEERKEIEPFKPIIEVMKEDSGFVQHIRSYLEGGGQPPASVRDELGLDENFQFDADDAISNPKSASGQVLNTLVEKVVSKRISDYAQQERAEQQKLFKQMEARREAEKWREERGLSEDDMAKMFEEMKSKKLTYDDAWFLMHKDEILQNASSKGSRSAFEQMNRARTMPRSAGGIGGMPAKRDIQDDVWNAIIGGGAADDIFGE